MGALLVLVPLLAVVLLNLPLGRLPQRVALGLTALLCVAEGVATVGLAPPSWNWAPAIVSDFDLSTLLASSLPVDDLARVMLLATALVGLCATMVAKSTIAESETRFRFANLLLLSLAGLNGIVLVRDLMGLYVFLEIVSVSSFILIALERGRAAFEGAFKYLLLSAVATSMILAGLALLFIVAGGTSFEAVVTAIGAAGPNRLAPAALVLFVAGLAVKAGLVPFHGWLPDAYSSAPSAVSVLLAGIVTKATGVYTLIRLVNDVFGYRPPVRMALLVIGLGSILVGALAALGQRDFKRMLAYSSISQVGYIILGLAAGPGLGLAGAIFHIFNHAVFKSLLFVNSAAVEKQSGTRDMDALGGISSRMPVTGTTSVMALLSTAGIPPFSGFWSKLLIIIGVWKAGHPGFAAAAVIASVITLAYFLSMQRRVFFGKLAESCANLKEADGWNLAPAILLAAVTLGLGLCAPWLYQTFLAFLLPTGSIL